MVEAALLFAFLAASVAFSLLLWQAVQGEGRGETTNRKDAERRARRDRDDDAADDEPEGWGAAARRDWRD
jgi:hypothetical protein